MKLTNIAVKSISLALITAFTIVEIINKETTVFYIIYLFWFDEFIRTVFDRVAYRFKKENIENPIQFQQMVHDSLRRQVAAINKLTANGMYFWDYGNAFLLEAKRAEAKVTRPDGTFSYPSYIQDIMGPLFFDWRALDSLPEPRAETPQQGQQHEGQDDVPDQVSKLGQHVGESTTTSNHEAEAQPLGPLHANLEQRNVGQHAANEQADKTEPSGPCIAVVAALSGDKRLFAVVVLIRAVRSAAAKTGAHCSPCLVE